MPSLGYYDLDTDEQVSNKMMKDALLAKTDLCKRAMIACHRPALSFHDTKERARWKKLEATGSDNDAYIQNKWLEWRIQFAEKQNATKLSITFPSLLYQCENVKKRNEWKAANATRLISERKKEFKPEDIDSRYANS